MSIIILERFQKGTIHMTKYEKAIYSMIQESTDHLTVYQVFEHLEKNLPHCSKSDCV